MTTRIEPTTTFPDVPDAILDYLVRRTSDTAGKAVAHSDAVIIGEVERSEARAGADAFAVQTRLRVEEWLAGSGPPIIDVIHDARVVPPFSMHDRALLFLSKRADAWETVAGRKPDPDVTEAVRWYVSLPAGDEPRQAALIHALSDDRPRVVHHAVRELVERRGKDAGPHIHEALRSAREATRTPLILGLWLAGEKDAATKAFETRKDAWLEEWGVRASRTDRGVPTETLFGPKGGNPWSIG